MCQTRNLLYKLSLKLIKSVISYSIFSPTYREGQQQDDEWNRFSVLVSSVAQRGVETLNGQRDEGEDESDSRPTGHGDNVGALEFVHC